MRQSLQIDVTHLFLNQRAALLLLESFTKIVSLQYVVTLINCPRLSTFSTPWRIPLLEGHNLILLTRENNWSCLLNTIPSCQRGPRESNPAAGA